MWDLWHLLPRSSGHFIRKLFPWDHLNPASIGPDILSGSPSRALFYLCLFESWLPAIPIYIGCHGVILSVPPRGLHGHWAERYIGLLASQADNWLPHGVSLSILTIMMAISCNHLARITHAYQWRQGIVPRAHWRYERVLSTTPWARFHCHFVTWSFSWE